MASVRRTCTARNDLEAAYLFIARDSQRRADPSAARIEEAVNRLALFPRVGRMVPEIGRQSTREIIVQPCRVVYRPWRDEVRILPVRHRARLPRASDIPLEDAEQQDE
jgi:plasmid stabilization system protein ParE